MPLILPSQHLSPKTEFKKGLVPWNKGKGLNVPICPECKGKKSHLANYCKKCSYKYFPVWNKNKKSPEISSRQLGSKNHSWKGGITSLRQKSYNSPQYKTWRDEVFKRDDHTCLWCGKRGGKLVADHIDPWAKNENKRFDIDNGRTLCEKCNLKTSTYGGRCGKLPYISMVIPTYTLNKDLEELAYRAACSYRPQVDELIIIEDGGLPSERLAKIANHYIYHKNYGFTKNVNTGWKNASGKFVMIVNSDTYLLKGFLVDLCIKGKVVSPEIVNQYIERLAGPFWVAPKEVTKERGYLMEEMKTYSSDSEYENRVADIFQKVPFVQIYHEQAQTVKVAGIEGGVEQQRDREIYARLIAEGKAK